MFLTLIAFFASIISEMFLLDIDNHMGLSIVVGLLTEVIVVVGGCFITTMVCKKYQPRHYEFVTWLMKFKQNEIEVGWFNGRYVIEMWISSRGWVKKEFGHFIDEDYKLNDESDKSKQIHMTIDLTKKDVEVYVENVLSGENE